MRKDSFQFNKRRFFAIPVFTFILFFFALPFSAHAATCTWTGAATNFWNNSANWSCGSVPADGDDAIINNGDTVIVDGVDPGDSGDIGVDNLTVNSGSTLNLNGFDLGGAGHPVVLSLNGGGGGTLQITSDETSNGVGSYTNSSNWSTDKESCTGTYEFIGDGSGTAETYQLHDEANYCNIIVNDTDAVPDTFLIKLGGFLYFWGDVTVTDGIYKGEGTGTNGQYFYFGDVTIESGGEFIDNGPVSSGNFSNFNANVTNNGGTYTHNSGLARFNAPYTHMNGNPPTTQYLTGDFTFNLVQLFDRAASGHPSQDGVNQKLILSAGSNIVIETQLNIWGDDDNDRFELLTDTPGTEATIKMGPSATVIITGPGKVTDIHLLDDNNDPWPGVSGDLTSGGNSDGWFNGSLEYSGFNVSQATSNGTFSLSTAFGAGNYFQIIYMPGTGGTVAFLTRNGNLLKVTLATPYDISSYTSFTSLVLGIGNVTGVIYNNDGSKAYYTSYVSNLISEYNLSVNYDLTTGVPVDTFSYAGEDGDAYSSSFNGDGTKLFMTGEDNETIFEYNLSVAYDVSTAVLSGTTLDLNPFYVASGTGAGNNNVRNSTFSQDGRRLYIANDLLSSATDRIIEIALSTPYDLTTATYVGSLVVNGTPSVGSASFDETGQQMFIPEVGGNMYLYDTNQYYPENVANDGSIDNSNPLIITLTGDTFQDSDADDLLDVGSEVTLGNVPPGLSPVLTLSAADTVATLTFTGNATNHSDINDVSDITFVFDDSAFSSISAGGVINSGDSSPYSTFVGVNFIDNPGISGTVYTDEGITNIGAGKKVTLLINGALADCGGGAGSCNANTNASGEYTISGADVNSISAGDILTVFIDDELENGVIVTEASGNSLTGLNIYQDYLVVRHDNSGSLTNIDLSLADNTDPGSSSDDISSIYSVDGSNILTTTSGTELLVWAGDTFMPGANIVAGGTVDVDGTINISTNTVNIAGNFDVDNFGTWTDAAGAQIIFDGTGLQTYKQGTVAINSDITISNITDTVSLAGNLNIGANDITVDAGATFFLNQFNITNATGTLSNEGTIQATGEENITITASDTDSGTWEFVDDGDSTAEVQPIGGPSIPISNFYNLIINSDDPVSGNRDTFQSQNNGLVVNGDFTVKYGAYSTANFATDFNGDVILDADTIFSAGTSAITIKGDFLNSSGLGFFGSTSTITFDSDLDHIVSGLSLFGNLAFSQTTNDGISNSLTFTNGVTNIVAGTLTLDGLDSDDRILILSDAPGTASSMNVASGAGSITADFLTVTDSNLKEGASIMNPALDPANSINGGNTSGWFTLASVEFSTSSASSTDESTADNFPALRISGTLVSSNTVDITISGGTATGGGTDYTPSSPITVTIPAGVYDGTAGTEIAFAVPVLVQDLIVEGNETIEFSLSNFGSEIQSGDADGDLTNESTHTYTITDDDGLAVQFTNATSSSLEATGTIPTLTVSGAVITSSITVEIATAGGTATGGTDYIFATPVTQTIPAGDYTTATAITISGLTIQDDTDIESNETIDLILQNPSATLSIGTQSTHTYTITDDDSASVTISVSDNVVAENPSDNGEFTVTMSEVNSTGGSVTVTYLVSGLATAGGDFAVLSGSADILNGASSAVITIDTSGFDDAILEGGETVSITLVSTNNSDVVIGATNSATLLIIDDEDDDGDSVSATDENSGFNGGDGNGDGILDSLQSNVTNVPNPVTGGSTTIDISNSGTCNVVSHVSGLIESTLASTDSAYDYPVGLVQFLIECASTGDTATVDIYYDDNYDTSSWVMRKYNSHTSAYSNLANSATVTITPTALTVGGQTVTKVSYQITDGSVLDTDNNPALLDRFIFDPVGPGVVPSTTPASSSGGGGGGGGILQSVHNVPIVLPIAKPASIEDAPLKPDLIGGGEPNVPPEFSDYVCKRYLRSYIVLGRKNKEEDVIKLEEFLNEYEGESLIVDGKYDKADFDAIVRFQKKYADQILSPWGLKDATGVVGKTTTAKINISMCSTQKGCPYFSSYMKKGDNSLEVVKLQDFINIIFAPTSGYPTKGIPLSKKFDSKTEKGVKEFQSIYKEIVLKPWNLKNATGWFYQTSRHASNKLLDCNEGEIILDNGVKFK